VDTVHRFIATYDSVRRHPNCSVIRPLFLLILFFTCSFQPAYALAGPIPPSNLRCEYLVNPLGIDVRQPRFAWILRHSERGQKQSAYQVLVASRRALVDQDRGDRWDSGKVSSDESTQVVYSGTALKSGHTYYWKVRYWDAEGRASGYSQPAQFEMGLLAREDWKGQWIGGANQLRTEFRLAGTVVRARAYICGLGYYELRINGRKVGNNVLDPGTTTYEKRVLYTTYDVTPYLERGSNAIGVMLGRGWYGWWCRSWPAPFSAKNLPLVLFFQMNVELANGQRVSIASGPSWMAKDGPVTSDHIYHGETCDARLETPGWDQPRFDSAGWAPAKVTEGPKGVLSAQMMPPIQVVDTIVPFVMNEPQPGVYVYDLGQNISGWAQLRVSGPPGTKVTMRFSELIYDNGMINTANLGPAKATDTYILRGEGVETYEPRFTYHGFRYVELTGYPGTPSMDAVRGRVVHSSVETTGSFVSSNSLLNQIQRMVHWGQLDNLQSIPTDCDQRAERHGWMGDAQISSEEAMLNFDMAAFYSNFIRDIRDTQGPDGAIPDTVPDRFCGPNTADPAWSSAYPLLCWCMWRHYGDRRVLEENYEGLKSYVGFLRKGAHDNVVRFFNYGDWIAVEPTPGALVADAYYNYDVQIMANVAKILGKSRDAETYSQLAGQIKAAFNREFYDARTGNYGNGSQTSNVLPLFLNLVPHDRMSPVVDHLINDINRHNGHLTCGFHGAKYLMLVLTQIGRADLAYKIATQTDYPSWGYMISKGATTVWELWQERTGVGMNSHNHPALGAVSSWFYEALGGINLDADGAGYRHIRFEPQMVAGLPWASATIGTVRGDVACSWSSAPGVITVDVTVPVNADAKILIPKPAEMRETKIQEGDRTVWENGRYLPGDPGILGANPGEPNFTFEVGSGHYSFRLTGE